MGIMTARTFIGMLQTAAKLFSPPPLLQCLDPLLWRNRDEYVYVHELSQALSKRPANSLIHIAITLVINEIPKIW